ncbi:MAG: DUF5915 domain-containing protein, partial [Dehalococcoidia bacterium]|nr:DUF5915 domain-containing protein [Dehalococcoidia bacterium]
SEMVYRNLVCSVDPSAPESVHLADYPIADASMINRGLMDDTRLIMKIASLGRAARSKASLKVRQPVAEVVVRPRNPQERASLERLASQILDELNVKSLRFLDREEEVMDYGVKPNLPLLGPKYGKEMARIVAALRAMEPSAVASAQRRGQSLSLDTFTILPEEVIVEARPKAGFAAAQEGDWLVAVTTVLTPELVSEGLAREIVHRVQSMRKSAGFDIADKITTYVQGGEAMKGAIARFASYVKQETLSVEIAEGEPPEGAYREEHEIEGEAVLLAVQRVSN